ncbi:MAG TPA: TetR/AcrR family transcriptional regulator [Trebonia sp.]|jgi:AcrR family transcriptional regulator|nr:TetR/AcrR family transcriptional regulator [Trebonia sp.]
MSEQTAPPPDTGLRERLIDAGVDLVRSEGAATVSLREIARRAGVSHGAPRRYFPTHLDLLSAIARRGFADLDALVDTAIADETQDLPDRLLALAHAVLGFASSNRGMYELMFRYDLLGEQRLGLQEAALAVFRRGARLVAEALPDATVAPEVITGTMWATLHGIVQLWGWGSLRTATGLDDPEPLIRTALDAYFGPANAPR